MAYNSYTTDADRQMATAVDEANSGLRYTNPEMDMFTASQSTQGLMPEMMQLQEVMESRSRLNAGNMARRRAIANDQSFAQDEEVFSSYMTELDGLSGIVDPVQRAEELRRIQLEDPRRSANKQVQESMAAIRSANNDVSEAARTTLATAASKNQMEVFEATKDTMKAAAIAEAGLKMEQIITSTNQFRNLKIMESADAKNRIYKYLGKAKISTELGQAAGALAAAIGDKEEDRGDLNNLGEMAMMIEQASLVDESYAPEMTMYRGIENKLLMAKIPVEAISGDEVDGVTKAKVGRVLGTLEERRHFVQYQRLLSEKTKANADKVAMERYLLGYEDPETGEKVPGLLEQMTVAKKAGDVAAYQDLQGRSSVMIAKLAGSNEGVMDDRRRSVEALQENQKIEKLAADIVNTKSLAAARTATAKAAAIYQSARSAQLKAASVDGLIKALIAKDAFGENEIDVQMMNDTRKSLAEMVGDAYEGDGFGTAADLGIGDLDGGINIQAQPAYLKEQ